jgi:hypothetical protein
MDAWVISTGGIAYFDQDVYFDSTYWLFYSILPGNSSKIRKSSHFNETSKGLLRLPMPGASKNS